ncbi:uncharacterized protein [Sinocyclocheilus grahami]|nr:PREDICTED: uncharacterized protein LOC107572349 [Sinocyclocheilus grahami]
MLQRNGGFHLEAHERDVPEQEKTEMKLSATRHTVWNAGKQTQINTFGETGSDVMTERRLINGLQSQQRECEEAHSRHTLNKEGAILRQMMEVPEVQNSQSFSNTIHHSFNEAWDGSETLSGVSSYSCPDRLEDSSLPELRLVLLGQRGSGKSAAGNIILGREEFLTEDSQRCVKARALAEDTRVSVVDTPDWFQSERSPEEVKAQISSCVALLAPGPHAFLLCIPVDHPAHSELPALSALEGAFGPDAVRRHTIVLFTRSELLLYAAEVEQVEAYITSRRPEMLELVQRCGDRYHVLQSGGAKELLEKVQQTVRESGGDFYSASLFQQNQIPRDRDCSLHALKEAPAPAPTPTPLRSVWQTTSRCARRVPKLLAAGALTGAALGVFLAGAVGGAVGAVLGSVLTEVGRRRLNKQKTE